MATTRSFQATIDRVMAISSPRPDGVLSQGDDDFESQWAILGSALREIHEKNASRLSFEQLYRASYKIVLRKQGDKLFDRVKEYEEQWFGSEVMPAIRKLITPSLLNITVGAVANSTPNERRTTGEEFMKGLTKTWEEHNTCMNMTTDVLMYLDRNYCAENRQVTLFQMAMGLYRDHILRSRLADADMLTCDILNSVILDQIGMERDGDVINKHSIRSIIYMLEALYESPEEKEHERLYRTTFEPIYLKASREFYQQECERLLREGDAGSWLRCTRRRLMEESDRCKTTVSSSSEAKISKVIDEEMISSHLDEFLAMDGSGIKAMIDNDRFDDLRILYQLISRVDPNKAPLKVALQQRVVELGKEINIIISQTDFGAIAAADTAEDAGDGGAERAKKIGAAAKQTAAALKWVEEVLRLKDRFDVIWTQCLNKDVPLQTAMTKSFAEFINQFDRSSEYVSLFIDDNLRQGIKGKTEQEVDIVLDKATTLIRYLQDKDMFETYYKKHLARRLIGGKSESTEVEKQMISRMKQEIGTAFTSKIEGMFKDMSMSSELTTGYRRYIDALGSLDRKQIDLGVTVLTTNYWPMEAMGAGSADGLASNCEWPSDLQTLQQSFKMFYLKERNGRKLTWLGFTGTADIRCTFPACPGKGEKLSKERRYELNVPTYGMIVLLLFNDIEPDAHITYEDILATTKIPETELKKVLYSLAVIPKARVLNKHPQNRDTPKVGDTFSWNQMFFSKLVKLKAPILSGASNKVEVDEERKKTEDKNNEHRGFVIDSVVVRIMKARKTHTHQQLFAEVIEQLSQRFKPDVNMIKKCVESLIEREYLERVEGAAQPTYKYLA